MGRPKDCDCRCAPCHQEPSCQSFRCALRYGGIFRHVGGDITPELGTGTASGITVIDNTDANTVVACNRSGDIYRSEDRGDDWTHQNLGATLNALHSRGNKVITVGDSGAVFRSTSQGATWVSGTSGTTQSLNAIWMTSGMVAYACGSNGTIIKTITGGITWSTLTTGVSESLTGIHFYNTRSGFAVGSNGTVIHTSDYGATWTSISGITADVDCVLMRSENDVVMFSRTGTTTRRWQWNGSTLTDVAAGPPVASGRLSMCGVQCDDSPSVSYYTQSDGCIVAPYAATQSSNSVYYYGTNGPITATTSTAQHQNRSGDVSLYTVTTKSWGDSAITSATLTNESSRGYQRPCIKASIDWTQDSPAPFQDPHPEPLPSTSYQPLSGAWVVCELDGGPHVTLSPGEWFEGSRLNASTKRIAITEAAATRIRVYSTINGSITGGTWTVTVNDETTAPLAWNASVADIGTAVSALDSVSGNVIAYGTNFETPNQAGQVILKWTDSVQRTVTVDHSLLTGTTIGHSVINAKHNNYTIIPIVIRDDVVYGPYYISQTSFPRTEDVVEECWQYVNTGPNCSTASEQNNGTHNYFLHSRYREFLESPTAWPSGIERGSCQEYCRPEDFFGEWSNAAVHRVVPILHREDGTPISRYDADGWVPDTLDFSSGSFTLGFAIGVASDVPGDYSIELLIDNICLAWSVRDPIPFCGGTLILDEPMSSSVPAWTPAVINHDPFSGDCDFPEQYFGANWRIESGWLVTDHVLDAFSSPVPIGSYTGTSPYYWRDRVYAGGSLFKSGLFTPAQNEAFCLTVECEVARLHEEDATILAADIPGHSSHGTSLDLNLRRPEQDCGIFIGGIAKFGVHRNAHIYGSSTDNHTCGRSWYYLDIDGRITQHGDLETLCVPSGHGTYQCLDADEMDYHAVPYGGARVTTRVWNSYSERAVPLKTDILRLQVTWANMSPTVFDCHADMRYNVRAWINNQLEARMTGFASNGNQFAIDISEPRQTAWMNTPSLGVYAHRGGKFRNFKAWLA